MLPDVSVGEILDLLQLLPEQHFTQPPPRFTEASLVKALEEYGIGRPSTYAAIISTIIDRDYVIRAERKLAPTELGFTVNDLLVKYFDNIFNVGFTATMEEHLDSIANGKEEMVPVLRAFYDFFEPQLRTADATMEKVTLEPEKTGEACPECGGESDHQERAVRQVRGVRRTIRRASSPNRCWSRWAWPARRTMAT